ESQTWQKVTAAEFLVRVRSIAKGLIAMGVQPGDMVAVMSATSYQWAVIDQAIWFAGAISVPIYETSSPAQIAHIVKDSQTKTIFIAGIAPTRAFERAVS